MDPMARPVAPQIQKALPQAAGGARDYARDAGLQKSHALVSTQRAVISKLATDLDESSVRRSFRNWFDWIVARATDAPLAVGILIDSDLATLPAFKSIAPMPGRRAITGLYPIGHSIGLEQLPWPWIEYEGCPKDFVLILCDREALNNDWGAAAYLQREISVWLTGNLDSYLLFGDWREAVGGVIQIPKAEPSLIDSSEETTAAAVTNDQALAVMLNNLLPPEIQTALRQAREADDLVELQQALILEQAAASNTAAGVVSERARANLSRDMALRNEETELNVARSEAAAEIKAVIQEVRIQRAASISETQISKNTEAAINKLMGQIQISSEELPESLVSKREKRAWWQGTWIDSFGGAMSRRYAVQLNPASISEALFGFKVTALESFGQVASSSFGSLHKRLSALAKTFPESAPILSRLQVELIQSDAFRSFDREPPGGSAKVSESVTKWRKSIEASFESFAASEARGFRMDIERKGILGRITEARSAVFGLYFLLVMALRPFGIVNGGGKNSEAGQADDNQGLFGWLGSNGLTIGEAIQIGVLALIACAFFVNLRTKPRQERAAIAERMEAKLEELHSRGAMFLDRTIKDHIGLLEAEINELASTIDGALNQRIATLKFERELFQSAPAKIPQGMNIAANRQIVVDGQLQRAALDLRQDLRDRLSKRLP